MAQQPTSGLSIRDWCDLQGVSEPSFYAWRRELARRAAQQRQTTSAAPAPVRFVELELPAVPAKSATTPGPWAAGDAALGIVVGDMRVEVTPDFDGPTLRQLLDVLRSMMAEGAARC